MEQQQIKIENYKSTFNNLLEKFKKINFMKDAHVSNSRYDAIKNKERHAIRVLSYCKQQTMSKG